MSRWWQNMWIKLLNTVWITYTAQLTFHTWLPTFIVRLHVSNQHNSTKNMLPIFSVLFFEAGLKWFNDITFGDAISMMKKSTNLWWKKFLFRRMHVNKLKYHMEMYVLLSCFLPKFGKLSWFHALFTNILHYLMRLIQSKKVQLTPFGSGFKTENSSLTKWLNGFFLHFFKLILIFYLKTHFRLLLKSD